MHAAPMPGLHDLPTEQPPGVPWPTNDWPTGDPPPADVSALLDEAFEPDGPMATTYAVVLIKNGELVYERYDGVIEHWDEPDEPVSPTTKLLSWSMAKSILHATVGVLVARGDLDPAAPAAVPEWQEGPDDPRATITLDHLLTMRDGLDFFEDYVDVENSDAIKMLFGEGQHDLAHYAATRPLAATPGERFNYSSGTSNIVSAIVARTVGAGEKYERFIKDNVLGPIGIDDPLLKFDDVGTWIGSSFAYMPARDFARFGYLYLRGGTWDGREIVPAAWVDHGRTPRSVDPTDGRIHGAHWWVVDDGFGTFRASGYEGQMIVVVPALDAVLVRLGKTPEAGSDALTTWRTSVVDALAR